MSQTWTHFNLDQSLKTQLLRCPHGEEKCLLLRKGNKSIILSCRGLLMEHSFFLGPNSLVSANNLNPARRVQTHIPLYEASGSVFPVPSFSGVACLLNHSLLMLHEIRNPKGE